VPVNAQKKCPLSTISPMFQPSSRKLKPYHESCPSVPLSVKFETRP
jgi:hypothetical protein